MLKSRILEIGAHLDSVSNGEGMEVMQAPLLPELLTAKCNWNLAFSLQFAFDVSNEATQELVRLSGHLVIFFHHLHVIFEQIEARIQVRLGIFYWFSQQDDMLVSEFLQLNGLLFSGFHLLQIYALGCSQIAAQLNVQFTSYLSFRVDFEPE